MAKHNQILDTVDECISNGVKKKILHLTTDDYYADGRTLNIGGRKLVNFASYSYMGLETDNRLKQGGIAAFERYGTQFGTTRAYASNFLYGELESLMSEIFSKPTLVAPSTTLAHQAAIPVLVRDDDAVILDQFVHASVQVTVKMVKAKGIPVELLRHNDLAKLEERIKELSQKHRRIWYMLDGVYSMYGDLAPLKELYALMDKYEQFYCYIDDTHGMSWIGKNGSGYALSQINYHPQMILVTCMNKAFASGGGAIVLPDQETKRRIRTCGDTLIFSGSVPPPMLGVGVACAKIHLTNEIYSMQDELQTRTNYCNYLLKKNNLPVVANNNAPIFFVGMSLPRVGHNMVKRLMDDGFYISIGQFPAVSMKCAGLRMCVTRHQTTNDIEQIIEAITYHYPKALEEEGCTDNDIRKAFKMPLVEEVKEEIKIGNENDLKVESTDSIKNIKKEQWDSLFSDRGSFDWNGLSFLERTFKNNPEPENNWEFNYITVKDKQENIVASTFYTVALCKEDMFSPAAVSEELEQKRKKDPYHLCSKVVMMGSLLSEGNHLYLDKNHPNWKGAMLILLEEAGKIQDKSNANTITLRDFEKGDGELHDFLLGQGFVKVDLPDAHEMRKDFIDWETPEYYLTKLPYKARHNVRRDVLRYEQFYDVKIISTTSESELNHIYRLYCNVKDRSMELNTFSLNKKIIAAMINDPNWEVITLTLKKEFDDRGQDLPIAVGFIYKAENVFCPMVVGIDYYYLFSYKNYKQIIYQVVKRARQLGLKKIYLGFTASVEKQKFGAVPVPKVAYVQSNDSFNMQVLELNKTQQRVKYSLPVVEQNVLAEEEVL